MLNIIEETIKKYAMLQPEEHVTVALSGGADSAALLHALVSLKEKYKITVSAAHLNHMIRGAEADRDEMFVRDFCNKLGVELYLKRVDVPFEAKRTGESLELAARRLRYAFLESVCCCKIATAHTASDLTETVIHNIARGTGIKGLCGIPPVRNNIIRPMISCSRQMVEDYCSQNNILYCTDSTNLDTKYTRNKIRAKIVPVLCKINPRLDFTVYNMCEQLLQDSEYINLQAEKAFNSCCNGDSIDVDSINKLHRSVRTRVLIKYYENTTGLKAERIHINEINRRCEQNAGSVGLPGGFKAEITNGVFKISQTRSIEKQQVFIELIKKNEGFTAAGLCFYVIKNSNYKKFNNLLFKNTFDYDKISDRLVIRNRLPGDKIKLCGRNVTKSLKKLFNESGVFPHQRSTLLVVSDEKGIVWIEGFGVDERVKVDEKTQTVVLIKKLNCER